MLEVQRPLVTTTGSAMAAFASVDEKREAADEDENDEDVAADAVTITATTTITMTMRAAEVTAPEMRVS